MQGTLQTHKKKAVSAESIRQEKTDGDRQMREYKETVLISAVGFGLWKRTRSVAVWELVSALDALFLL